ncbi:MAG: hypothetical protein HYW71_01220 [Candidatus Niyogibacteria bacterium]|nr:hypothetical protein [Candidatus Niyogibacteria bacterium]
MALNVILERILYFFILIFGIFILPWPALFGFFSYLIARFSWAFELIIVGIVLDAFSGLPFGFFSFLFLVSLLAIEFLRSFFYEQGFYVILIRGLAAISVFFILETAFFGIFQGAAVYGNFGFWKALFFSYLTALIVLFSALIFHLIISYAAKKENFF